MTFYHPKYYAELRRLRKLQAEATSNKRQATEVASDKHQATSEDKKSPQASSDKQQASGFLNPSLTSAKIQVPGNNLQEA